MIWKVLLGALVVVAGLAFFQYRTIVSLKVDAKNAATTITAANDINAILTASMIKAREAANEWRGISEELANVQDDNACVSPAIDHAFDIVRKRRNTKAGN